MAGRHGVSQSVGENTSVRPDINEINGKYFWYSPDECPVGRMTGAVIPARAGMTAPGGIQPSSKAALISRFSTLLVALRGSGRSQKNTRVGTL